MKRQVAIEDYLCDKCGQVVFGGEDICVSCGKRINWDRVKLEKTTIEVDDENKTRVCQ